MRPASKVMEAMEALGGEIGGLLKQVLEKACLGAVTADNLMCHSMEGANFNISNRCFYNSPRFLMTECPCLIFPY